MRRSPSSSSEVVVTGIGMRTPVGLHAVQACASIRAGINRFRAWKHLDGGPPASCFTPDLGDGPWWSKAQRLLEQPFQEALWSAGLEELPELLQALRPPRLRVFIAGPSVERARMEADDLEELRAELSEDVLPDVDLAIEFVPGDQVAGLAAVAQAGALLASGKVDVCVVAGVDSRLDSEDLRRLNAQGRLKTPDSPSGLIPGEAAAAVVLETSEAARRRGAVPLARIRALGLEQDPPFAVDAPLRGEAMSRALSSVLPASAGGGKNIHRLISDLNGERWRFLEAALVETRCFSALAPGFEQWRPADCVGDVGAAYGPVAMGLASRAFERGYAGPGDVLILATAESGARAAMTLEPGMRS